MLETRREAPMTSSRLPGKVMLPALDCPMLAYPTSRLKAVPSIDEIGLATTVTYYRQLLHLVP